MEACNYWPISLISIASKVFERIVRDTVEGHIHRHYLLYDAPHGFHSGRSCPTYLLIAMTTVTQLMDDETDVDIRFLNLSNLFDVVYHRLLRDKLATLGGFHS